MDDKIAGLVIDLAELPELGTTARHVRAIAGWAREVGEGANALALVEVIGLLIRELSSSEVTSHDQRLDANAQTTQWAR